MSDLPEALVWCVGLVVVIAIGWLEACERWRQRRALVAVVAAAAAAAAAPPQAR